ncbi:hypothetical protein [Nitrososphaera sp. AFS]|uniref:hypothetical protein n=1 Tax=Nitrososphaera sp. AFS TaxID=2301191 RepID=UPI001F40575D|nr:hypothetical protein [Nitrososphaera sp. AFS]
MKNLFNKKHWWDMMDGSEQSERVLQRAISINNNDDDRPISQLFRRGKSRLPGFTSKESFLHLHLVRKYYVYLFRVKIYKEYVIMLER